VDEIRNHRHHSVYGPFGVSAEKGYVTGEVPGSRVCFADAQALKIRCVDQSTGLIQGYGTGVSGTGGDGGNEANASFMSPSGVAFDNSGNWYISDFGANSVRRVDAVTGTITMFAGPGPGYCCVPVGDGGPRSAPISTNRGD
jgi:hypothetical protein